MGVHVAGMRGNALNTGLNDLLPEAETTKYTSFNASYLRQGT